MCMFILPTLIIGLVAALVSIRNPQKAPTLELLSGILLMVGLGMLGFCLPLYR